MRNFSMLALVVVGLVACRGGDNGDDQPTPDGSITGDDVTIQQIQSDSIPSCDPADPATCTPLTIKGVVVTAIDAFGSRTGDIYVEEPGGGEFSGVKVYNAPIDVVAGLAPGDIIDIGDAVKDDFQLTGAMLRVTELKPVPGGVMSVKKVSSGALPTPSTVDAAAIAMMTADQQNAEWEKWEGVLITVVKARQTTDVGTFGAGADDQKDFDITGGASVVSALTPMPTSAVAQTCYAGITGIGDYAFSYLILPRSSADLVGGATDCPGPTIATISAIQAGTLGAVEVRDVYVTALSFNKKNFWVSTSLTAAPNEGIYVYRGNATTVTVLPTDVVVGAKVNITGTAVEGNNDQMGDTSTQITGPAITVTAAPSGAPVPVTTQTAETLNVAATGEPYESVLVKLTAVKVNNVGTSANFYVGQLQQGATTFISDDDVLRLQAADVTKCFDMTGIWSYNIFENAYAFLPITKDMEVTCP
jgi:hypothetical protein